MNEDSKKINNGNHEATHRRSASQSGASEYNAPEKKPVENKSAEKAATPTAEAEDQRGGTLRERLSRVKPTRWVRFGLVSVLFFAWVAWLGNWWVAPWWLLLVDIYLTQYIPWSWWRHSKSSVVRNVMSWVDAIVYALILVYFLFAFVGQNYQIPSSSLEKTLLTGDFLWVNKMVYGPRVPQTPLHFPLAQNTMPIIGGKSYIENPQFAYHRLKGWRNVERGDIVVFNYPCGDTVALGVDNAVSYYELVRSQGRDIVQRDYDVVYRPVDRRDAYVKRCVGLPGDSLKIVNGVIICNGTAEKQPENVQFFYLVKTTKVPISDELFDELGISAEDHAPGRMTRSGDTFTYALPLTAAMRDKLKAYPWVMSVTPIGDDPSDSFKTYPLGENYGWTHTDYGPIWIPKKGATVDLSQGHNYALYERCIRTYEGNTLERKGGKFYINGKDTKTYTFKMDYYWMMGDNRDNSLDSRYWGFVPEDHIIGTPMVVLISFDKDKSLFKGGIRWNRVFKGANPDKK